MNAEPQWIAREPRSIAAIDNLRSTVILLVVAVHALLPYYSFLPAKPFPFDATPYMWRSFPLIDTHRLSLGFDIFSGWIDVFVMATFFLVSGLFVWPCLTRKGPRRFIGERVLRLGLPFVVGTLLLLPIATVPTYLQTAIHPSLVDFWQRFLALPFWPSGPLWFLWVLLVADILAAAIYALVPRANETVMRLSSFSRVHPWKFAAGVVAASAAGYIPLALLYGPLPWGQFGPLSIQLCRPAQYAVYFFAGIVIGACGVGRELTSANGALARHWRGALVAAIVGFGVWLLALAMTVTNPSPGLPLNALTAATYVLACFMNCWAALALSARFAALRTPAWNSLRDNAYGIYLVHFVFAIWVQYALLPAEIPAIAKAAFTFTATLTLSWGTTAVLRRLPGFAVVIGTGRSKAQPALPPLIHPVLPLAD